MAWTTSANRKFSFGLPASSATVTVTYESDVGSGYLVGIFGNQDTGLNSLGFAVLRSIQSAELINLEYPQLNSLQIVSAPQSIKTISYDNSDGSVDQTFNFAGKDSVIRSSTWSITVGVEVGLQLQIKGGIPLLFAKRATVTAKVSVSGTYESTNTETSEELFNFPIKVPAGKIVKATAILKEANIDTPYNAELEYTLDTGKTLTYNTSGTYSGVDFDMVEVAVEEKEREGSS